MIDPAVIGQICDQTDIVALVRARSGLALIRRGRSFWALCPFHGERTPSLHVIPKQNRFYCFGCKKKGGPIDWLIEREGMSFKEAVGALGAELGISLEDGRQSSRAWAWAAKPPVPPEPRAPVRLWPEEAIAAFAGRLPRYLADRGVTVDAARAFGIGHDPVAVRGTFPVRMPDGGLVGLSGRVIPRPRAPLATVKYLNYRFDVAAQRAVPWIPRRVREALTEDQLAERFVSWERPRVLMGADVAARGPAPPGGWRDDNLYLVEGQVDVAMTWQRGCRTVSSMGSGVCSEQIELAVSLVPPRGRLVVFADPDPAGEDMARAVKEMVYGRVSLWQMRLRPLRIPGATPATYAEVVATMSDEALDLCLRLDPGNANDLEFEAAYTAMAPMLGP